MRAHRPDVGWDKASGLGASHGSRPLPGPHTPRVHKELRDLPDVPPGFQQHGCRSLEDSEVPSEGAARELRDLGWPPVPLDQVALAAVDTLGWPSSPPGPLWTFVMDTTSDETR